MMVSKKFLEPLRVLIGRLISSAGAILITVLALREFPLEESGKFLLAFTSLTGVAILAQFGQNLSIIRESAAPDLSPEDAADTFYSAAAAVLVPCVVISALLAILSAFQKSPADPVQLLWSAIIPCGLQGIISSYFKGRGYGGWGGFWEQGIAAAFACVAFLILPLQTANQAWLIYSGFLWLALIISSLHLMSLRLLARPQHWRSYWRFDTYFDAKYLGLIALLSYLSQWGGVLLAKFMIGDAGVAVLNGLYRLLAPLQFVILTLDSFLAPKFSKASAKGARGYLRIGRVLGLMAAIPYVAIALSFSGEILNYLFGESGPVYAFDLALLLLAVLIQMALGPTGICLNMRRHDQITFLILVLKTGISFIGALLIVPFAGFSGFVYMFTLSIMAQAILQYVYVQRDISLSMEERKGHA
ncbi:MAG: lipopolysaccharide biosynthesis protein [Tsuneonella suprasediminis]|nr:hypothetical protein LBX01_03085 [Altererythrobacter sp. N1]